MKPRPAHPLRCLVLLVAGQLLDGLRAVFALSLAAWRAIALRLRASDLFELVYPVDACAALAVSVLLHQGDVNARQERRMRLLFMHHFSADADEAQALWRDNWLRLHEHPIEAAEVHAFLHPSRHRFAAYHVRTLRLLLAAAQRMGTARSDAGDALVEAVDAYFTDHVCLAS